MENAKIVRTFRGPKGRIRVELENGQIWERSPNAEAKVQWYRVK